jgi:hypothetical protein
MILGEDRWEREVEKPVVPPFVLTASIEMLKK